MKAWATHPAVLMALRGIFLLQIGLLWLSYNACRPFVREDKALWVLGVREVANCLHHISGAFPGSITVNFAPNKYYRSNPYCYNFGKYPAMLAQVITIVAGPALLGYLACRAGNFFYLWNSGFLLSKSDGRGYEFAFLKARGKRIVCYFCGSDIRSPELSIAHGKRIGYETMMSNIVLANPGYLSQVREEFLKQVAMAADRHADVIFNAPVDQIGYLEREVQPFLYFYPDEKFVHYDEKFEDMKVIRILHAPSSPFIKGTQLVRAAIRQLREEGYCFEYTEITDADNVVVLEALKRSHIVVNELYAFLPGIFGVEAMASHCALLTSADASIEPSLPEDSSEAWLLTRYWDVTDKLRSLLQNPARIKPLADAGFKWAKQHASLSASQAKLRTMLEPEA